MKILKETLKHWYARWPHLMPIIFLLAVAGFARFAGLHFLPGGLFPDEAANGLDVNAILSGDLKPFYERGNGREALFFYLLAPFVWLFGRSPFAHHFVSAGVGTLIVLLTYLLAKRWFTAGLALVAALLAATSAWHITLSRTAFRANTAPLFALLFFYFATRVVQAKTRLEYWLSAILTGLSFGLGFYTYISYRMMIPLVAMTALLLLAIDLRSRPKWQLLKKYWRAAVAGMAAFGLSISWLVLFFGQNPEWLTGRSGQISIFSPSLNNGDVWGTFGQVAIKTLAGFVSAGDLNWRHNVSGFPFLSPFVAPFWILGLLFLIIQSAIFVFKALKRPAGDMAYKTNLMRLPFFLLTAWFGLMLVPELLTAEGIPHGLRLIGVIPAVFIIPALAIIEIIGELPHLKFRFSKFRRRAANLALIIFLGGSGLYGLQTYFGTAGNSAEYAYAFRSDLTVVSDYLNARDRKQKTYLVLDWFSQQSTEYLTTQTNQPYRVIDPETLWSGPQKVRLGRFADEEIGLRLAAGDQVIFAQSTVYDSRAFEKFFPEAKLILKERNRFNEVIMMVYEY